MSTPASFEPVTEIIVDERAGIAFGRDEECRISLLRGLADVTQGRVARRDDLLEGGDEE